MGPIMSIILIRHGETALNGTRVLQPPDTPLSDRGRRQADAVALRFAGTKIGGLVSSDLARAVQTSQAIATACGLAICTNGLLQERNFGDLRGRPYDRLGFDPIEMHDAPPGGESIPMFTERVMQALDFLRRVRSTLDHDLLVVSHGLFIRTLLAQQVRMPQGVDAPTRIDNTAVTVISPEAPHHAQLLNNSDHLSGELRDNLLGVSGV